MSKGIDYGMGTTNIDNDTGIRFGVIHQHEVLQVWADEAEANYGGATCPKCGNEAVELDHPEVPDFDEVEDWEDKGYDHACLSCKCTFDSDEAFGDEPLNWTYKEDGYETEQTRDDGDIFITKSLFYTRAAFCSPCAPGACHLSSPCENGEKAYCFSHDWFEGDEAPYPVFRVEDDSEVAPEK